MRRRWKRGECFLGNRLFDGGEGPLDSFDRLVDGGDRVFDRGRHLFDRVCDRGNVDRLFNDRLFDDELFERLLEGVAGH